MAATLSASVIVAFNVTWVFPARRQPFLRGDFADTPFLADDDYFAMSSYSIT
jgi:hypothetical protein